MQKNKNFGRGVAAASADLRRGFRDWELRGLMFFGGIIIMAGVAFYMIVEGWDFIQALYFCVATLTTVGYGDLHPTNDISRLFTTAYVLVGVGFILGFVNVVARQATKPIIARMTERDNQRQEQSKD
ncbi:MAG TPA: potassium channel family protein [Candidatus Saccharimonadales bacterium]|nr:potassium channel family protein [Candidatus Saccharimonadales bacterium]